MIKPADLQAMPDVLGKQIQGLEADILNDAARRIKSAGYLTATAQWQVEKAQALRSSLAYSKQRLAAKMGMSSAEINKIFTDASVEAIKFDDRLYEMAGVGKPMVMSQAMQDTLTAAKEQTRGTYQNYCNSAAVEMNKDLGNALDKAFLQIQSGAFDAQSVMKQAIKGLAATGLTMIDYKSGRKTSLEAATRRAVVTGVNQTAGKLQLMRAEYVGWDLMEITSHAGSRPDHAWFQGKIFSISGKHPTYPALSETGYGQVDGLLGANCRHNMYPFLEGVSQNTIDRHPTPRRDGETYDDANNRVYKESQKQREIERNIRKWKREADTLGLAGMPNEAELKKVREWQAKMRAHIDATGRTRRYGREGIGKAGAPKPKPAPKPKAAPKPKVPSGEDLLKGIVTKTEKAAKERKAILLKKEKENLKRDAKIAAEKAKIDARLAKEAEKVERARLTAEAEKAEAKLLAKEREKAMTYHRDKDDFVYGYEVDELEAITRAKSSAYLEIEGYGRAEREKIFDDWFANAKAELAAAGRTGRYALKEKMADKIFEMDANPKYKRALETIARKESAAAKKAVEAERAAKVAARKAAGIVDKPVGYGGVVPDSRYHADNVINRANGRGNLPKTEMGVKLEETFKNFNRYGFNSEQEMRDFAQDVLDKQIKQASVVRRCDERALRGTLNDGRFKSQFEIGDSDGAYNPSYRTEVEGGNGSTRGMFVGYDRSLPVEMRPIYGTLENLTSKEMIKETVHSGSASRYGEYMVVFERESVEEYTTMTFADSFSKGHGVTSLIDPDYRALDPHIFHSVNTGVDVATMMPQKLSGGYLEVQIHGQTANAQNIQTVYRRMSRYDKPNDDLRRELARHGINYEEITG